ncbi:uncharacterized protein LOC143242866 [Tachypleus tridentatus]|uniref:uncharacterized protein LOC143242866 n=1 Tax=Tachypleus tridentatus TaxID=6853 RepID=UPI003FD1B27C
MFIYGKLNFQLSDCIHPVGNIGREQGSFWWPLLGAYLTYPLYFWDLNSVFSVFFNWYSKKWQRKPLPRRSISKRLLVLSFVEHCTSFSGLHGYISTAL